MKSGNEASEAQEYLERCIAAFQEALEEFRKSQPALSCTCNLSSPSKIMLQFKMQASTIRDPLKIARRERQTIKPFVDRLVGGDARLRIVEHSGTNTVVSYYLGLKEPNPIASRTARAEARKGGRP
jgi:hypothetical protein